MFVIIVRDGVAGAVHLSVAAGARKKNDHKFKNTVIRQELAAITCDIGWFSLRIEKNKINLNYRAMRSE